MVPTTPLVVGAGAGAGGRRGEGEQGGPEQAENCCRNVRGPAPAGKCKVGEGGGECRIHSSWPHPCALTLADHHFSPFSAASFHLR